MRLMLGSKSKTTFCSIWMKKPVDAVAIDLRPFDQPALDLKEGHADHEASVTGRFLAGVFDTLRTKGASGAGQAVRRATRSVSIEPSDSRLDEQRRALILADHLMRVWTKRALASTSAYWRLEGLESLGRVHDADDAAVAADVLSHYVLQTGEGRSEGRLREVRPVLQQAVRALEAAGRLTIPSESNPYFAKDVEDVATSAGRTLVEAFMVGAVGDLAAEARSVIDTLNQVRIPAPSDRTLTTAMPTAAESRVQKLRRDLDTQRKKQGDEESKAARADELALKYQREAEKTSSPGLATSRRRSSETKRQQETSLPERRHR